MKSRFISVFMADEWFFAFQSFAIDYVGWLNLLEIGVSVHYEAWEKIQMVETSNQTKPVLNNPGKTFYLYIGAEADPGWRVALAACSMTANTIPLRVGSFNDVNNYVLPPGNYVAVSLDWNGQPRCFLSEEEAVSLALVRAKIADNYVGRDPGDK